MTGPRAAELVTPALQLALVAEASQAPSVHNVQPARWRFGRNGWLTCFHEEVRSLRHGDPTGRDVRISIGAAVEGMAIAAGRIGYTLEAHAWGEDAEQRAVQSIPTTTPAGKRAVALLRLVPGGRVDPLADFVEERHSWRGRFARPAAPFPAPMNEDLTVIAATQLVAVARWHDDATWHFEQRAAYHAELWRWLRLSRRHPDWARDGLNAEALVLSRVERVAAAVFLRPRLFAMLGRLGVARTLVSESAAVRSASALLVFAPPTALDEWTIGRRFYRAWLEATRLGIALAPMSALADWEITRRQIAELARIPPDRGVVNVFRAGTAPASHRPRRARLPAQELLV